MDSQVKELQECEECDSLFLSIRRISHIIDLHSKCLVKSFGLSLPQLLVMHAVRRNGSVPIRVIAEDVWLSQATVSTIIDRLEIRGYLQRARSRYDRRIVHVELTPKGNEKLDERPSLMQPHFVNTFRNLDSWEQQMLMSSLDRVARMLNDDETAYSTARAADGSENNKPPGIIAELQSSTMR